MSTLPVFEWRIAFDYFKEQNFWILLREIFIKALQIFFFFFGIECNFVKALSFRRAIITEALQALHFKKFY